MLLYVNALLKMEVTEFPIPIHELKRKFTLAAITLKQDEFLEYLTFTVCIRVQVRYKLM